MKIKLALLDSDQNYLKRIVSAFETKYADKLEIYSFTDMSSALLTVASAKIDVFLVSETFEIDASGLPNKCGFAYFVDGMGIEAKNNQKAICKFQKVDQIYKQILSIYAEKSADIVGLSMENNATGLIVFQSPSGGVGTSTVAAACALHFALRGKRVLYLNLECYGNADEYYTADGQFNMSDVIYAIKSKKVNMPAKLESCVKYDERGVYYYSPAKIALDMLEFNEEDKLRLLNELKLSGSYDYIIVDSDFSMEKDRMKTLCQANALVWVCDGTDTSNGKIERAFEALSVMENKEDYPLTNRLQLLYNRVSSKDGKILNKDGLKVIGGMERVARATTSQIVEYLAKNSVFEELC